MRARTYVFGVVAAFGATMAGFAGCGGNVNTVTGGTTGSGGATTTTTTTASTTTTTVATTTTTTTTSTSSGAGGSTPCDLACQHVEMCLGVTCAQANIDCATVGSGFDCAAECINNLSCSQLTSQGMACLNATCDGGAADGGETCQACLTGSCASTVGTCFADTSAGGCAAWLKCAQPCLGASPIDPACFSACDAQFPNAAAKYDPVYACACSSCNSPCAAADTCKSDAGASDAGPLDASPPPSDAGPADAPSNG